MTDNKPKGKKRTSKEVLAEIKRLYAAKKYPEALKLCDLLLKKHPNNKDLHGLRQKIANRCGNQEEPVLGSAVGAGEGGVPDLESTVYYTQRVEEAVGGDSGPAPETEALVEKFIKEGVGFYDVQDYERAIECWEQALALDPDNSIANDYIENVRSLAAESEAEPEPEEDPNKPNKDQLLAVYNEGMEFFRQEDYPKALEKWEYILSFHPNHKETIQCIEKTKTAMATRDKQTAMLEDARAMIAAGKHAEAENLVNELVSQNAKLEGLDQLKEAVAERKRRINEIRSLEIEDNEDRESDYSATDDEITRYFTPESQSGGTSNEGPRQVTVDLPAKKKKKPVSKAVLIGVPVTLLILGIGGWFAYNTLSKQSMDLPMPTLPREVRWVSPEQRVEDFLLMASDFRDESEYLLAAYAYQRVEEIAKPRLDELKHVNPAVPSDDLQEKQVLEKQLAEANQDLASVQSKIAAEGNAENAAARADAAFRKSDFEEASKHFAVVLALTPDDVTARERYAAAQEQLGFGKLKDNELDVALQFFRRATVLKQGYDMNRRHTAVIDRFFQGKISEQDKDQWFYFFIE